MSDPILHAETLEIEGAARDDYYEWMAAMEDAEISSAEPVEIKYAELEDIPC